MIIATIVLFVLVFKYGDFSSAQSVFPVTPIPLEEDIAEEKAAEDYKATHTGKPNFAYTPREGEGCVSDKDCVDSPPLNYLTNTMIWCRADGICEWK